MADIPRHVFTDENILAINYQNNHTQAQKI